MIFRGRQSASVAFTSGTTSGTSVSIRNADELSIRIAPWRVMSSAYSRDTEAPADANTMSIPLNASPCSSNSTFTSFPQKQYAVPALREEPNSRSSVTGKCLSASTFSSSCPTAPEAPTIATFIDFLVEQRLRMKELHRIKDEGHKIKD